MVYKENVATKMRGEIDTQKQKERNCSFVVAYLDIHSVVMGCQWNSKMQKKDHKQTEKTFLESSLLAGTVNGFKKSSDAFFCQNIWHLRVHFFGKLFISKYSKK